MASCGRFIDIGNQGFKVNHRSDVTNANRNRAYFAVEIDSLKVGKPDLIGRILSSVSGLLFFGQLQHAAPIIEFPTPEANAAFWRLQSGETIGKIVVKVEPEDHVKVRNPPQTLQP